MTLKIREARKLIQNELDCNISETKEILNRLKSETDVNTLENLESQYKKMVKSNFFLEKALKQLNKSIKNIEKAEKYL